MADFKINGWGFDDVTVTGFTQDDWVKHGITYGIHSGDDQEKLLVYTYEVAAERVGLNKKKEEKPINPENEPGGE
jgi:hypothetical protein